MKHQHITFGTALFCAVAALLFGCAPTEFDDYSYAPVVSATSDALAFEALPTQSLPNEVTFRNITPGSEMMIISWDLGNGTKTNGQSVKVVYPIKGTYTVTMTASAADGTTASVSKVVTIAEDNFGLLDTPIYRALTGGKDDPDGKTWVFDQYHDGHFGVGPAGEASPIWWSAPAGAKDGSSLYNQKYTFIQDGTRVIWRNNGYVYTNAAGLAGLGNPAGIVDNPGGAGDFDVPFTPKDSYTFSLNEGAKKLTLSNDAFFGFFAGNSTYEILNLTETELYLKVVSNTEPGNAWFFRLIPEELNVPEESPKKGLKEIPFLYTFEEEEIPPFTPQDMGVATGIKDNPYPLAINMTDKVFRYQKSDAFYSNIFLILPYILDLKTQNKFRVKVFIPSFNDYDSPNNVVGDWISEKRLRPQLSVKLQDSTLGDNAWSTQEEVVIRDIKTDQWVELIFDFAKAASRKDLDKIVLQFGGEGHSGSGIFFFDDLQITK